VRRRLLIILFPFFVLEGSVAIDGSIEMADEEVVSVGTHIFSFRVQGKLQGEKVSVFKLSPHRSRDYPIGYFAGIFWNIQEQSVHW
jgi:hypothetical protein